MPAHMNTESRRKASAAYHAKREAEGLKKVTLWLGPEAREKLEQLKAEAGSKDKAAELAIMAYGAAPVAWPSGAAILPEHTEDLGPTAPLKVSVPLATNKPVPPGSRLKAKK